MTHALDARDAAENRFPFGDRDLTIQDLVALARGELRPTLGLAARDRMRRSAEIVGDLHDQGESIYGVTTSVGASVRTQRTRTYDLPAQDGRPMPSNRPRAIWPTSQ